MKILVVEDSQLVTRVLQRLLHDAELPFEPVYCDSFATAAEALDSGDSEFFAALVDLHLPDAPNGEIVECTLAHQIPTIVLTASYSESRRDTLLQMGVVDYVVKESRFSYEFAIQLLQRLLRNRSTKILLAEDSRTHRNIIRQQLESHLYEVVEASNGQQALEILEQQPDIRLLMTDFQMPVVDGIELVQRIRKKQDKDELIIIGLSAEDKGSLSAKFIKNGANDFLRKPFNYEELHCRLMHNLDAFERMQLIRDMAYRDYLTGLYNRRYLFEYAEPLLRNRDTPITIAVLDLDNFKQINDTFGHDGGDVALKAVANRLQNSLTRFTVARVGGEEFAILFTGLTLEQGVQLLDSLRELISNEPITSNTHDFHVSFSAGLTEATESEHLSLLMNRADKALYLAKEQGRNQVIGV